MHSIEIPNKESLEDIRKTPSEKETEALNRVEIEGNLYKFFMIGTSLDKVERQELLSFLFSNIDMFAWSPYEMPGVDPFVAQQHLNIDPKCKPIIQRSRWSATKHTSAVVDEID